MRLPRTSRRPAIAALPLACLIAAGFGAEAQGEPRWPDTPLARVELLALIQTLNASLLASRSATATLEGWCAAHRMAAEPKIVATRVSGPETPPSDETRKRLGVLPGEVVKHRHVRLSCGGHVLSEADNWYVPGRLSPEANRILETTDTPFGKAIAAMRPFRRTFEAKLMWSPLPEGWEMAGALFSGGDASGALGVPHDLLEHRAVVYGADNEPFSEVHEIYSSEVLDFDANAPRR